jgi:hypothetical protein
MKPPFLPLRSGETFEEFEQRLARNLGLSCSLATLRKAEASLPKRLIGSVKAHGSTPATPALSEKQQLEQMFAGKSTTERMALVRANKARIRAYLGLPAGMSAKAPKGGTKYIHRSLL